MVSGKEILSRPKFILLFSLMVFCAIASILFIPSLLDIGAKGIAPLSHIIWKIRLPEVTIAIIAGANLGLAGALMQIILENPLASPWTLGISSASSFGAGIAIAIGYSRKGAFIPPSIFSLVFSLLGSTLLLIVSGVTGTSKRNLILLGMAINFLFGSFSSLLHYYSTPEVVYQISQWTSGTLTNATMKDSLNLIIVLFIAIGTAYFLSRDLSYMQLGTRETLNMGVNVTCIKIVTLVICAIITSLTVCVVGIIGFIGLVAPHFTRLIQGKSPKELIIFSPVIGAVVLLFSDAISRKALYPQILPIGAITSLLGIPFLLCLILRVKDK